MAQGSWAMSTFEALESQTRSGIAIEFINVLILAETEDDAARMLQAKANASEPEARIAIGDSRSAGVEPVVSVSRYEFSQDLSELATMSSLGEAVFGFEYATRVSKLSIPLLDLYRPRLEVDLKEGSLLFHEIPLTGTARDPNDDEMSLGVEIGNLSLGISVTSGPFSWPLPIGSVPDGNVTVVLNLSDGYLFDISSFEAVVDNHPPEIRLENVMNNTVYSAPLSPRISASDVIDPSPHLTIELDGEAFGLNQSVGEGWHILRIHAEDEAGWSREVEYTFAVDPSPPMIQLVTPAENGTWHHPPLTIWWRIDDEHTTPRGSWRLDGGDWRKGREHNSSLGKWEHESWLSTLLEAPEGGHLLELRVIDRAGNTAQSSLTLVLDATPPNLTISGVEDQGRFRSPVMVEIGASDGVDPDPVVIALLNGAPFAGGTEIGVGIHQLEVRLSDKAGNEADFSASFIVDTTPPTLWANISDGAAYARSVTIQHEASDDLGPLEYLSVTLDGKSYDGGMIPPGEHVFQMDASDSVGNSGGLRAEFLIDVTSPEISVSVGDRTWHTRPVELVVSVVDDLDSQPESEIMIDGQPLAAEPIGEGNHSLVAWARDSAGNFATLSTRFYVDTTAPTISIVGVADNRTYARSVVPKVTVSDTVDESPTVSMTLNGEPHLAGSRLLDGTYTLEVQARDGAGNEDRRSLTFVIDTVPPTIEVSIEEGAIYVGRVVPEIRAFDQRGSVSKEIILDGEPYDEGKAIGPGTHNLLVRARDVAGNVAEAKLVFTVKRGILQWVLLGVVFAFIAGAALLRTLRRRETRPQMYRFG
jgi:hypothetical protein